VAKKKNYYAVKNGRKPGIYTTWADCQQEIIGFSGAVYKGFETLEEAQEFMKNAGANGKRVIPKKVVEEKSKNTGVFGDAELDDMIDSLILNSDQKKDKKKGSGSVEEKDQGSFWEANETNGEQKADLEAAEMAEAGMSATGMAAAGMTAAGVEAAGMAVDEMAADEMEGVDRYSINAYTDGSYDAITKAFSCGVVLLTPNGRFFMNEKYSANDNNTETRNVAGELKGAELAIRYAMLNGYRRVRIYHDYEGVAAWAAGEWQAKSEVARLYVDFIGKASSKIEIQFQKVAAHTGNKYNEIADKLAKSALII
jgi:ribonuclease HI